METYILTTVYRIDGNAAVLVWDANGDGVRDTGVVIPNENFQLGQEVELTAEMQEDAIEYGIDWDVLLQTECLLTSQDLQIALRQQGVWTLEDFQSSTPQVVAAIQSCLRKVYAQAQTLAHQNMT